MMDSELLCCTGTLNFYDGMNFDDVMNFCRKL